MRMVRGIRPQVLEHVDVALALFATAVREVLDPGIARQFRGQGAPEIDDRLAPVAAREIVDGPAA